MFFFFQAEDGIRDLTVTGVQTCALPIYRLPVAPPNGRRAGRAPGGLRVWSGGAPGNSGGAPLGGRGDRKSGVEGKRVDLGGRRILKKKKKKRKNEFMRKNETRHELRSVL